MQEDYDFINLFNEYYPFERYIVINPKPIDYLFDDALLIEIFAPYTEIKPVINNGHLNGFTSINEDEVYVKIKGKAGEMRFSYFSFSENVRETIRDIIINDIGQYEYESLYVEHENGEPELANKLKQQKELITKKYGECNIKKSVRDNLV
ncbi:MAG: hypothetical protein IKO36_05600 [Bacteroidaceae bacterium]|nr:hypothetical protein [Bacteroidaceae bacterium]